MVAFAVISGLSVGIAFVIILALLMQSTTTRFDQPSIDYPLPQVSLLILDANNSSYSGEKGSYCWFNGCADTGIIIPSNAINVSKGSVISFEFIDRYHDNRAPEELGVAAFDLHRDLKIVSATEGRVGGDVEIAAFDFGDNPIPYMTDIGNRNYILDLAEGEYVIWAASQWYLNGPEGDRTHSDGDIAYFYRIIIT